MITLALLAEITAKRIQMRDWVFIAGLTAVVVALLWKFLKGKNSN